MIATFRLHRQSVRTLMILRIRRATALIALVTTLATSTLTNVAETINEILFVPRAIAATGIYKPISYQGRLTNADGSTPSDGQYNMRFSIYDVPTGGSAAWTETWNSGTSKVTMTGGLFSVLLGSHTAMSGVDFNTDNLYLQVEFDPNNDGTYPEDFLPRRRFASVPYALNADMLDGLDSTQFVRTDTDSTITSGKLSIDTTGVGLEVSGTASGKIIHAQDLLASSGSLSVEGLTYLQGAAVFGSTVTFNNVTYTFPASDGAASGKVLATNGAGQLSWTTVSSSSLTQAAGDARWVNTAGDTMTGGLLIQSGGVPGSIEAGLLLEISGTASGRVIHAQNLLTSSGGLSVAGATYLQNAVNVTGNVSPTANASYDLGAASFRWNNVYANQGNFTGLITSGNHSPLLNVTYDLGGPTARWSTIYGNNGNFSGNLNVSGTVTVGNAGSDLSPTTNNTYDLGNSTNRWRTLYAIGGNFGGDVVPSANVTYNLGSPTLRWSNIYGSTAQISVLNITGNVSGNLSPSNNVTFDLGNTSNRWRDIYANTANIAGNVTLNGVTYTFPASDGAASGKVLATNGAGQLSWTTVSSSGITQNAGDGRWVNTAGDTMTGGLLIQSGGVPGSIEAGLLLEISGTASGRVIHAENLLTSSGGLSVDGVTYLNNATNASGNITPTANASYDLGYSSLRWNNIFGNMGNFTGNVTTGNLSPQANQTYDLGSSSARWATLYANTGIFTTNVTAPIFTGNISGTTGLFSGNVGIGVSTVESGLKLEVAGTASGKSIHAEDLLTSSGALSIDGVTYLQGNINLGDSTSDNVTFTGRINSSLIPSTNATYDLGSDTLRWRDLYVTGASIHIGGSGDEGQISYNTTNNYVGINGDNAGSPDLVVLSTGFIGIGTTNPETALEVAGTASGRSLHASNVIESSGSLSVKGATSLQGSLTLHDASLDCDAYANGGVLTTVDGVVVCADDDGGAGGGGISQGEADDRYVNTAGDTMTGDLIVNANVGVGVTPTEALDVNGGVRIRGTLTTPVANSLGLDYDGVSSLRLIAYGPDTSNNGVFKILTQRSDGSNSLTAFTIAGDGNITFGGAKYINGGSGCSALETDSSGNVNCGTDDGIGPGDVAGNETDPYYFSNPTGFINNSSFTVYNGSSSYTVYNGQYLNFTAGGNVSIDTSGGAVVISASLSESDPAYYSNPNGYYNTDYWVNTTGDEMSGNLTVNSNNSYDLGNSTNRWNNLFANTGNFSGPVYASNGNFTNLYVSDSVQGNLSPSANSTYDLGNGSYYWNNIYGNNATLNYVNSSNTNTTYLNVSNAVQNNLSPSSNSTYDLGNSSYMWNYLYANNGSFNALNVGGNPVLTNSSFTVYNGSSPFTVYNGQYLNFTAGGNVSIDTSGGAVVISASLSESDPTYYSNPYGYTNNGYAIDLNQYLNTSSDAVFSHLNMSSVTSCNGASVLATDASGRIYCDTDDGLTSESDPAYYSNPNGYYNTDYWVNTTGDEMSGTLTVNSNAAYDLGNFTNMWNYLYANNGYFGNSVDATRGYFDYLNVSTGVETDLSPTVDNSFNLGNSTNHWNNLWANNGNFSGTASGRHLHAETLLTSSGVLSVSGATFLQGNIVAGTSTGNLLTVKALLSGSLLPSANVTYDLGSSTLRWRDLYLSGSTLHMGADGDEATMKYDTTGNSLLFDTNGDGIAEMTLNASNGLSVVGNFNFGDAVITDGTNAAIDPYNRQLFATDGTPQLDWSTAGIITLNGYTNGGSGCSSLETDASGNIVCGTDAGSPFTLSDGTNSFSVDGGDTVVISGGAGVTIDASTDNAVVISFTESDPAYYSNPNGYITAADVAGNETDPAYYSNPYGYTNNGYAIDLNQYLNTSSDAVFYNLNVSNVTSCNGASVLATDASGRIYCDTDDGLTSESDPNYFSNPNGYITGADVAGNETDPNYFSNPSGYITAADVAGNETDPTYYSNPYGYYNVDAWVNTTGDSMTGLLSLNAQGDDDVPVIGFYQSGYTNEYGIEAGVDNAVHGGLVFKTVNNGTKVDAMVLTRDNGRLGIGVTNPNEKLTVNGAVKVLGEITTNEANAGAMDYSSNTTRFFSWGADVDTLGGFAFLTRSSDASDAITAMTIAGNGDINLGGATYTNGGSGCSSLETDASGNIVCGTDAGSPFTLSDGTNSFSVDGGDTVVISGGAGVTIDASTDNAVVISFTESDPAYYSNPNGYITAADVAGNETDPAYYSNPNGYYNTDYWVNTTGDEMSGNLTVNSNNSYDLGNSTNRWNNLFANTGNFSGPVYASNGNFTNLYVSDSVQSNLSPSANSTYDLGNGSYYWNNIYGNNGSFNALNVGGNPVLTNSSFTVYNGSSPFTVYNGQYLNFTAGGNVSIDTSGGAVVISASLSESDPAYYSNPYGYTNNGYAIDLNQYLNTSSDAVFSHLNMSSVTSCNGASVLATDASGRIYCDTDDGLTSESDPAYYSNPNGYYNTDYWVNTTGDEMSGNLTVNSNNSYDLGNSTNRWNNLFANTGNFSGPVYASNGNFTNLYVSDSVQSNLSPSANSTYDLGNGSYYWNNIYGNNATLNYVNSSNTNTTYLNVSNAVQNNLSPSSNSTYSLGNSSNIWSDIYGNNVYMLSNISCNSGSALMTDASGKIYCGAVSAADTFVNTTGDEMSGNLTVNANAMYDLGNSTNRWNTIYGNMGNFSNLYVNGFAVLTGESDPAYYSNPTGFINNSSFTVYNGSSSFLVGTNGYLNFSAGSNITIDTSMGAVNISANLTESDPTYYSNPSGYFNTDYWVNTTGDEMSGTLTVNSNAAYDLGNFTNMWNYLYANNGYFGNSVDAARGYFDYLNVSTGVETDLNPTANNSYNLGNSSNQWAGLYIVSGNVSGELIVDGTSTLNGNVSLGSDSSDKISANGRFNTSLIPDTDITYDLGADGYRWRDLWISGGTIHMGNTGNETTIGFDGDKLTWGAANFSFPQLDCSGYANGGKLTVDANGDLACADDSDAGGSFVESDPTYYSNPTGFITSADLPDLSGYQLSAGLATVATSGQYSDLTGAPDLSGYLTAETDPTYYSNPTGFITAADLPDLSGYQLSSGLALVATSGDYNDLINKPDLSGYITNSSFTAYNGSSGFSVGTNGYLNFSAGGNIAIDTSGGAVVISANLSESDPAYYSNPSGYISNESDPAYYSNPSGYTNNSYAAALNQNLGTGDSPTFSYLNVSNTLNATQGNFSYLYVNGNAVLTNESDPVYYSNPYGYTNNTYAVDLNQYLNTGANVTFYNLNLSNVTNCNGTSVLATDSSGRIYCDTDDTSGSESDPAYYSNPNGYTNNSYAADLNQNLNTGSSPTFSNLTATQGNFTYLYVGNVAVLTNESDPTYYSNPNGYISNESDPTYYSNPYGYMSTFVVYNGSTSFNVGNSGYLNFSAGNNISIDTSGGAVVISGNFTESDPTYYSNPNGYISNESDWAYYSNPNSYTNNSYAAVLDQNLTSSNTPSFVGMNLSDSVNANNGYFTNTVSGVYVLGNYGNFTDVNGGTGNFSTNLSINSETSTSSETLFQIISDVNSDEDAVFRVTADGTVYNDNGTYTTGADYAEWFYTSDNDLRAGEAVCVDVTRSNAVKRCTRSGDNNVMGIISTKPGFVGNVFSGADGIPVPGTALVGLIGQVPGKVMVENDEPIQIGDSLTTASVPGYMRKAHAGESTVGVALEGLASGQGTIQVLISRRNQSLTVDMVEDRVLQSIKDMNVSDQIESMLAQSINTLTGSGSAFDLAIDDKLDNLDLRQKIREELWAMSGSLVTTGAPAAQPVGDGASLSLSVNGPSVLSGSVLAKGTLTADALVSEKTLMVAGDAAVGGDLYLQGMLKVEDLFVPGMVTIDGAMNVGSLSTQSGSIKNLEVENLDVSGSSRLAGSLIIDGRLEIGSGALALGEDSTLEIGSLIAKDALHVLGDITISGLATFLGDVTIKGQLTVSSRQAGYVEIPVGGTGATVTFSQPFTVQPVVTASPDVPVLYGVSRATMTGFVIRLKDKAEEKITFGWTALGVSDLAPMETTDEEATLQPFPVDAHGVPLTGNAIEDGCLRNQIPLDDTGHPYNCSRYHEGSTWQFGAVTFQWNTLVDPPLLTPPEGYTIVVQGGTQTEQTVATEPATATGDTLTGTGDTLTGTGSTETGATEPVTDEWTTETGTVPPVEQTVPSEPVPTAPVVEEPAPAVTETPTEGTPTGAPTEEPTPVSEPAPAPAAEGATVTP